MAIMGIKGRQRYQHVNIGFPNVEGWIWICQHVKEKTESEDMNHRLGFLVIKNRLIFFFH